MGKETTFIAVALGGVASAVSVYSLQRYYAPHFDKKGDKLSSPGFSFLPKYAYLPSRCSVHITTHCRQTRRHLWSSKPSNNNLYSNDTSLTIIWSCFPKIVYIGRVYTCLSEESKAKHF